MSTDTWRLATEPFEAERRRLCPPDAEVIDVHTHLGRDDDGSSLDLETLLHQLDTVGARRACVFALNDPERAPAYRVPNDRVLEWAAQSEGRLVPFCRVDPGDEPVAEAKRCLKRGARGIKLHPREQQFDFERGPVAEVFAFAEAASVPLLIHAGRGLPPIADGLAGLALRHPELVLILAHAAIADQALLADRLADHPGVLYDTSCLFALDVLDLYARAPAERIVFGSDPPYGHPAGGLYLALRCAQRTGLDQAATRNVVGGTIARLLDGRGLPPASAPRRLHEVTLSGPLSRAYTYCVMTASAIFGEDYLRARAGLELALAACRDPDPGPAGPALELIGPALTAAHALLGDPENRRPAMSLVHLAMARAVTEPLGP